MTRAEFNEVCLVICPHCAKGETPTQGIKGEWGHVMQTGNTVTSTICWANGLRNSRFAREATQ